MTQQKIQVILANTKLRGDVLASVEPGDGIAFTYELAGPQGAIFTLYRETRHTAQQIVEAKRWLRNNRDVVAIDVLVTF